MSSELDGVLEKISVLELKKDDVLVLNVAKKLSLDQKRNLENAVKKYLINQKVMVLDEGMSLEVIRAQ